MKINLTRKKINQLAVGLGFVVLFCYVFLNFLQPLEIGDFWWHLHSGRFIVQHGSVPLSDPFTVSNQSIKWTYTQWLGSVVFYAIGQFFGLGGLPVFRAVIFLLVFFLFFRYSRDKIPPVLLMILILLISGGLGTRTQLRPYLFNFIFIQLVYICFSRFRGEGKYKILFVIPFLGVLWFNLHLGAFYCASIIFFSFFVEALLATVNARVLKSPDPFYSGLRPHILPTYIAVFMLYYLGFVLNPYGVEGAAFPFRVFFDPKFINLYYFNSFISEQQPPAYLVTWKGLWFYLLVFFYLFTFAKAQKKNISNLILFCVSLLAFLYSQRMSAFFSLMSGYLIVDNYCSVDWEKNRRFLFSPQNATYILVAVLIPGMFLSCLRKINAYSYVAGQRRRNITMVEHCYAPGRTTGRLLKSNIKGTVFNFDRYGGYLLWYGYPQIRPFVDGRQLDKEAWEAYRLIVSCPEEYWPVFEQRYGFVAVLVDAAAPFSQKTIAYFINNRNWQIYDVEGITVTFIKKELFQDSDSGRFAQGLRAAVLDKEALRSVLSQAGSPPHSGRAFLDKIFFPDPYYNNLVQEGAALFVLGYQNAGINMLLKANMLYPSARNTGILKLMAEGLDGNGTKELE